MSDDPERNTENKKFPLQLSAYFKRHGIWEQEGLEQKDFQTTRALVLQLLSILLLFNTTFRRLDSVSVFWWNLRNGAQSVELVRISGHQSQSQSQN
jgi:hypothetical protein